MRRSLLILLLTPFLLGVTASYRKLAPIEATTLAHPAYTENEAMLFPDGNALQAVAFGYKNFLSNILWFQTISYFGKHFKGDRNYKWLSHMCSVVFELDSRARHVPEFCSLMLAWEADDTDGALSFLDTAIKNDPEYWRYYYLRGITNILFKKDPKAAKDDFLKGSQTPNAPTFLAKIATKTLANLEDPATAISFLKGMVHRARDPNEKATLERHLKQTIHDAKISKLEQFVAVYKEQHGQYPDTLSKSKIALTDPYGGTYFLNKETGKIQSTSGKKKGKTLTNSFIKKNKDTKNRNPFK